MAIVAHYLSYVLRDTLNVFIDLFKAMLVTCIVLFERSFCHYYKKVFFNLVPS